MKTEELKNKILKVLNEYPIGAVATMKDGKPWVRYMVMKPGDDLALFSTSFASARKVGQIKKNSTINVAFGADRKNWMIPYINVDGTAEVLTDIETKKKCWDDHLKQFFKGPEDPNYVVIKVIPESIEYMNPGVFEPEIYA